MKTLSIDSVHLAGVGNWSPDGGRCRPPSDLSVSVTSPKPSIWQVLRGSGEWPRHSDADVTDINPTTLRFSRRLGDACRGSEYARAVEFPFPDVVTLPRSLVVALVVLTLLAAIV